MSSDTVPRGGFRGQGRLILDLLPADDPVSVKLPRQATVLVVEREGGRRRVRRSRKGQRCAHRWLDRRSVRSVAPVELRTGLRRAARALGGKCRRRRRRANGGDRLRSRIAGISRGGHSSTRSALAGCGRCRRPAARRLYGSIHAKAELPAAVVHQLDGRSSTSTTLDQVHAPIENPAGPDGIPVPPPPHDPTPVPTPPEPTPHEPKSPEPTPPTDTPLPPTAIDPPPPPDATPPDGTPPEPPVEPHAHAPELAVGDAAGSEDSAIRLDISAELTDSSESLSITIAGVPDGARLSAGTDNGDGTWSLTPDQLIGLTITPPSDSDADFTLTVTATSTGGSDAAATSENLVVVVQPVSDAPMLDVVAASGLEDTAIPLDVRASLTDATEILTITLAGVPSGAVLSSGTDQGNGTWSLTPAQLSGLTITPPANSASDFTLTVTAMSTDGSTAPASVTGTLAVAVAPVSDAPVLTIAPAFGPRTPRSRSRLRRPPAIPRKRCPSRSPGYQRARSCRARRPGRWNVDPHARTTRRIGRHASGTLRRRFHAHSHRHIDRRHGGAGEHDPDRPGVGRSVSDALILHVADAAGTEDTAVPLDIGAAITDPSEVLAVTISGMPAGATLSAGTHNSTEPGRSPPRNWRGTRDHAAEQFRPGLYADSHRDFAGRQRRAGQHDRDPDGYAGRRGRYPDPSCRVGAGERGYAHSSRDRSRPDRHVRNSVHHDRRGPGRRRLSAGAHDADGTWTLDARAVGRTDRVAAANSDEDFTLTITATSKDGADSASTSTTLTVVVDPVSDAPTLVLASASGLEDTAIPLDIRAALGDPSEVISVSVAGMPADAVLSAGTHNADGTWTLTAGAVDGAHHHARAQFRQRFHAHRHGDRNRRQRRADERQRDSTVTVDPESDAPRLQVTPAQGSEDTGIPLDIRAAPTDLSEVVSVTISGVPVDAVLSAGTHNPDGTWTLTSSQLAGLKITPPANSDSDFTLMITATSRDGVAAPASVSQTLVATVDPSPTRQPWRSLRPPGAKTPRSRSTSRSCCLTPLKSFLSRSRGYRPVPFSPLERKTLTEPGRCPRRSSPVSPSRRLRTPTWTSRSR